MKSKQSQTQSVIRLDKWLWAARFYKTRGLARDMIQGGKVHYNGQRVKPSKAVEIGAELKFSQGYEERIVVVQQLLDKRQSAPIAQSMYEETIDSINKRNDNAAARKLMAHNPKPEHRPDKKQRRALIKFKHHE